MWGRGGALDCASRRARGGYLEQARRAPVFVLGDARSGTTLVYSMLLASGQFPRYEEGETHLLECRSRYGPLQRDANWRRFLADWLASLQFTRSGLDAETFLREAGSCRSSYTALMACFMDAMCRREEKPRWAEKTPAHTFFIPELARAFPDARFVHVIRDGRDVAASKRKLGWAGTRSRDPIRQLVYAIKAWERVVALARREGGRLAGRYLEIRYEDVVRDPAAAATTLGAFAGVPLSGAELQRSDVGALGHGYTAFGGEMQGVSRAGLYRWKHELTPDEQAAANATAGRALVALGYELAANGPPPALGLRAYAAACPAVQRVRWAIRHRTPLGRVAPTVFEMP